MVQQKQLRYKEPGMHSNNSRLNKIFEILSCFHDEIFEKQLEMNASLDIVYGQINLMVFQTNPHIVLKGNTIYNYSTGH
jgi:hypothetical protein